MERRFFGDALLMVISVLCAAPHKARRPERNHRTAVQRVTAYFRLGSRAYVAFVYSHGPGTGIHERPEAT